MSESSSNLFMDKAVADARVTAVIVNFRTPTLTKQCVASLRHERRLLPRLSAIVVDGGSGDSSTEELSEFLQLSDYRDWVKWLPLSSNGGFGWANNQAILSLWAQKSRPAFVYCLNPDTEVMEGAAALLVREMVVHPRCAAAGSQLFSPSGERTGSAFRFPSPGRELVNGSRLAALGRMLGIPPTVIDGGTREVDWVSGASVMFRTDALREAGLFDDGFFLYFEEVELMHRLRSLGWTVRHVSRSKVVHDEGSATQISRAVAAGFLPAYWYRSRLRYFALTGGRTTAVAANFAYLLGSLLSALKWVIGRPSSGGGPRVADLLRMGMWPSARDVIPSAPSLGEDPGRLPAWMSQNGR